MTIYLYNVLNIGKSDNNGKNVKRDNDKNF